jgi:hypothetical protein
MSPFVITYDLLVIMGTFFFASLFIAFHVALTNTPTDLLANPLHAIDPIQPTTHTTQEHSTQTIHPTELPIQTAEDAVMWMRSPIQLVRTEQVRVTPPIRLIHMSKMNTL